MSEPLVTWENLDYALQILREVIDESKEQEKDERNQRKKRS